MTSVRGSFMSGLRPMQYGLGIVEGPVRRRYLGPMKTVLITGCSSGYGLETARHFHAKGWNVVATMRTPRDGVLPRSDRAVLLLDVTRPGSTPRRSRPVARSTCS